MVSQGLHVCEAGRVTRVFDGEVDVDYSQTYLKAPEVIDYSLEAAFAGQTNGLCGAAIPGLLFLTTGLHTGVAPFTVDVLEAAPELDNDWEDQIEASFVTPSVEVWLGWGNDHTVAVQLPSTGTYRVRYAVKSMDEGRRKDTRGIGEPEIDRYALVMWPAPTAPDAVLRTGSDCAAYWHRFVATLPAPPAPGEIAAAAQEAEERERLALESAAAERESRGWGGALPSARLRALGPRALSAVRGHRDVLEALDALPAGRQRELARWLARRAFERADLAGLDWVAPALTAIDRGEALPPPFTSRDAALARVLHQDGPPRDLSTAISRVDSSSPPAPRRIHRPSFAVPTIFAAMNPDPFEAVRDSLHHCLETFDDEAEELIAEVRSTQLH